MVNSLGASQGGVLLKHLPYLPVATTTVVGSAQVGVGGGVDESVSESGEVLSRLSADEVVELEQKIKVRIQEYV